MCTPGLMSPLVNDQHRLTSPTWQGGHRGVMPRGAQLSHGLSSTRCPTSTPSASGPRATTSATTSWPGTWGSEEKAAIGLSMSPSWKSPSTSLASEPHTPERRGRVTTQSAWMGRASSTSWSPNGSEARYSSSSSVGTGRTSPLSGRAPKTRAFMTGRRPGLAHGPHAGHEPVEVPGLHLHDRPHVGNVVLEQVALEALDDVRRPSPRPEPGDRCRPAGRCPGWSQISVSMAPGSTSRTETPVPTRSAARASLHPARANFDALYAASVAIPAVRPGSTR